MTPYQFSSNMPIDGVDLDGLEFAKDNNVYLLPMRPVLKAPTTTDAVSNVFSNLGAVIWMEIL